MIYFENRFPLFGIMHRPPETGASANAQHRCDGRRAFGGGARRICLARLRLGLFALLGGARRGGSLLRFAASDSRWPSNAVVLQPRSGWASAAQMRAASAASLIGPAIRRSCRPRPFRRSCTASSGRKPSSCALCDLVRPRHSARSPLIEFAAPRSMPKSATVTGVSSTAFSAFSWAGCGSGMGIAWMTEGGVGAGMGSGVEFSTGVGSVADRLGRGRALRLGRRQRSGYHRRWGGWGGCDRKRRRADDRCCRRVRPWPSRGLVVRLPDRAGDHIEPLLECGQPREQTVAVARSASRSPPTGAAPRADARERLSSTCFARPANSFAASSARCCIHRQLSRQDAERQRAHRRDAPQPEPPHGVAIQVVFVRNEAAEPALGFVVSEAVRQRIGIPCHNLTAVPRHGRESPVKPNRKKDGVRPERAL